MTGSRPSLFLPIKTAEAIDKAAEAHGVTVVIFGKNPDGLPDTPPPPADHHGRQHGDQDHAEHKDGDRHAGVRRPLTAQDVEPRFFPRLRLRSR